VAEEREVAWASLSRIEGVSDFVVQTLYNHGFRRARDVMDADAEFLASLPGFAADAVPRIKEAAKAVVKAEKTEKAAERLKARERARLLMAIETCSSEARAKGVTDLERLQAMEGMLPYALVRLQDAMYESPEDIYFDDDIDRLVGLVGFSAGKARQLRRAANVSVHALTKEVVPVDEKPLSEPEKRDAEQFDLTHKGEKPADKNADKPVEA
jgi:transcription termination/antitermination protein NusA